MTTNTSPTPNPRKFAEKIALLKAKEAESTAQFDHVMRDVHGGVMPPNHAPMVPPNQSYGDSCFHQHQQPALSYGSSLSTSAIPTASQGTGANSGGYMTPHQHPGFTNLAHRGNSSGCIPSAMSTGLQPGPMGPIWEGQPTQSSANMHPSSMNTSLTSGAGLLHSDSPKIYASSSLPNFPMAMMGMGQGNSSMQQQQQQLPPYSQSPSLSMNPQRQPLATQSQPKQLPGTQPTHPQHLRLQQHQHSNNSGVDLQGALHSLENIKTGGRQYVMDQLNKRILKHMNSSNTVAALGGSRGTASGGGGGGGNCAGSGGGSPHHHHHHNHHHHSHHHHLISQTVPSGPQALLGAQRNRGGNSGSPNLGSPTSPNHRLVSQQSLSLPTPPPGGYTAALLGTGNEATPPPPPPYQLEASLLPNATGSLSNDNWRRTASDSAIHSSYLQQQQQQPLQQQAMHQQHQPMQQNPSPQHQQPLLLPTLLGASTGDSSFTNIPPSGTTNMKDDSRLAASFTNPSPNMQSSLSDNSMGGVKRSPSGPVYRGSDKGMIGPGIHNNLSPMVSNVSNMHVSNITGTMVGSLPDLSGASIPTVVQNHQQAHHYHPQQQYPHTFSPNIGDSHSQHQAPQEMYITSSGPNSVPASVPLCHSSNPTSPSSDVGVAVGNPLHHHPQHQPPKHEPHEQAQAVYTGPSNNQTVPSPHTAMHLTQEQFERFNMNERESPPCYPVQNSSVMDPSAMQQPGIPQPNVGDERLDRIPMACMTQEAMMEMAGAGRIPDIILTEPEMERRDSFNLTHEVLSSLGCNNESLDNMMDFTIPQTDVDQLLDVDDSDLELLNDPSLVNYVADPAIEEQLRKEHKQLRQL